MSVTIRRAKPAHARRLTDIAHAAKAHWRYPARWLRLWRADLTVTSAFIRAHPVFYARRGRRIAGFYALSRDGGKFELEHFWVDPDEMGAGVGAKLFRHVLATIRSAGGHALRIASDPNAEGFYQRMGARRVGRVASTPKGRSLPLLSLKI